MQSLIKPMMNINKKLTRPFRKIEVMELSDISEKALNILLEASKVSIKKLKLCGIKIIGHELNTFESVLTPETWHKTQFLFR